MNNAPEIPEKIVKTVEIKIDNETRRSPEHTTGEALYVLGRVQEGYELLEERQHGDDVPVPKDGTEVNVHEGERFHSVPIDLNPGS